MSPQRKRRGTTLQSSSEPSPDAFKHINKTALKHISHTAPCTLNNFINFQGTSRLFTAAVRASRAYVTWADAGSCRIDILQHNCSQRCLLLQTGVPKCPNSAAQAKIDFSSGIYRKKGGHLLNLFCLKLTTLIYPYTCKLPHINSMHALTTLRAACCSPPPPVNPEDWRHWPEHWNPSDF